MLFDIMIEENNLNKVTPDMALLCVSMNLYQTITQRNHSSLLCIGQVDKYSQHKFERTVFWLPRWVVVGLVPSSTSFFHPRMAHTHIYIKIPTCHRRVLFTLLLYAFYLYMLRYTSWIWTTKSCSIQTMVCTRLE